MRLHTVMTLVFCMVALVPILLFWLWPNSHGVSYYLQDARSHHRVLASNLAGYLGRYHDDISGMFHFLVKVPNQEAESTRYGTLLEGLHVRYACVTSKATGNVIRAFNTSTSSCPERLSEAQMAEAMEAIKDGTGNVHFSPIRSIGKGNGFVVVRGFEDLVLYGVVSAEHILAVGREISFGDNGRAIILDQSGNVISHYNDQFVSSRRDFSDLEIVGLVLAGRSGAARFHEPVSGVEMVAGFSPVAGAGWAVIVPQPVSELIERASAATTVTFSVVGIGIALAALVGFLAARMVVGPLEQMVTAMRKIGNGELRAYEQMKQPAILPLEFSDARDAIKAMSEKLRENIDTISQHAFLDGVTGLPNRECFRVLATQEILKCNRNGKRGAILFLDLDGFKQVNDVHGHRAGDDLLKAFAQKLYLYSSTEMKRNARGHAHPLIILPARLGGDEFVVFLGNVDSSADVEQFAHGLFSRVFGRYVLHNNLTLDVSGSVGAALFPDDANDFDELIRLADIAMYEAKKSGKGRYVLHNNSRAAAAQETPRTIFENA